MGACSVSRCAVPFEEFSGKRGSLRLYFYSVCCAPLEQKIREDMWTWNIAFHHRHGRTNPIHSRTPHVAKKVAFLPALDQRRDFLMLDKIRESGFRLYVQHCRLPQWHRASWRASIFPLHVRGRDQLCFVLKCPTREETVYSCGQAQHTPRTYTACMSPAL